MTRCEIIKRLTHVRKNEIDAIAPTRPLEHCLRPDSFLTPSIGAHLLTRDFCQDSTFYREQGKLKATSGIELTLQPPVLLAEHLLPLHQLFADRFRQSNDVKIDETPIRCLDPGKSETTLAQF